MLPVHNKTPWDAGIWPGFDQTGQPQHTVVFKACYHYDEQGNLSPASSPVPIVSQDVYADEVQHSNISAAAEQAPFKSGSELLIHGSAYPYEQRNNVLSTTVSLSRDAYPDWHKTVFVFGARHWQRKRLHLSPSDTDIIDEPIPLSYELAYGGTKTNGKAYRDNPIGQGFRPRLFAKKVTPLAQIENPGQLVLSSHDKPQPAGFGPLPSSSGIITRMQAKLSNNQNDELPYITPLPETHFNVAPLDQRFYDYLFVGGEHLRLEGLDPQLPSIEFSLPQVNYQLHLIEGGQHTSLSANCDTVIVDSDARLVKLLFRHGISNPDNSSKPAIVSLSTL